MNKKLFSKYLSICVVILFVGSPFFAITPLVVTNVDDGILDNGTNNDSMNPFDNVHSPTQTTDSTFEDIPDRESTNWQEDEPRETNFPFDMFERYGRYPSESERYTTDYYEEDGSGLHIEYYVVENHLFITVTVGSYDHVGYTFDEGTYDTIQINGAETSATYGAPALPYKNIMLYIPEGTNVLETELIDLQSKVIYGIDVIPGPEPLEISSTIPTNPILWFDPVHYLSNDYLPENNIETNEVGIWGEPALHLTLNPLRYNPILEQGELALKMQIVVTFDQDVTLADILTPNDYQFDYEVGGNYVFVVDSAFVPSVGDFASWKTSIGWNVEIVTVQDIYTTYPGSDHAEELRNFIIDEYQTNGTLYYLLVGDCDIVPAREVWDPAAGPGLDNGTEPSDLYFECLDGTWNENGNTLYGESDDNVDFFPEVMVGRLPVQTTSEAEKVLSSIISVESNPEPGSWIDNFMLIAPDCFGSGDGVNMVEEVLNQKHLVGSYFDTYRFYPTDGSLSNSEVINQINSGVSLIDFFDHGAYDVWVGALTVAEALALTNGNRTALAFGMACETAAFDVEAVEPVIGEALFRAPNGGLHTYIAATRVAWAGYHCFDGFHHRFWDQFFADIFDDRVANPKIAFHAALNEMATIFDVNTGSTRETIYQAIYFGDPTLHMSWKQDITTEATEVGIDEEVTLNGTCLQFQSGIPLSGAVNVTVHDPIGRVVYDGYPTLDIDGEYSVIFDTNELAGNYSVETTVWNPFEYSAATEFIVGNPSMTLQLDSSPIYYANLSFSGMTPFDGSGSAFLTNLDGTVLETIPITTASSTYSNQINVSGFGWLKLYVHINGISDECGRSILFKVSHGEILVISDITGGGGPSYPGGWPLSNYGDSGNYGELREALEDEYEVTEWRLMFDAAPDITYLHEFDAVLVSMGDANAEPLVCAASSIIDVLQQYHNEGGNLLFEGGSFLSVLESSYSSYFSSLFHVTYDTSHSNSGSLYLDSGGHSITSGIPSSVLLEGDLGSDYVDVFSPAGSSQHVSGYSGSYSGGTAISALSADAVNGSVVIIGFAIDAIQDEGYRYTLIKNSVGFLLHPTLTVTISDYAIPFGTSETLVFNTSEASTGTPVVGAEISLSGCGVTETDTSDAEGSCSIFVDPSSFGEIIVEVSKAGFLNYTTIITVYDKPVIAVETNPIFAEKDTTQTITIITTEYYEGVPLDGCQVNLTGCGISVTGVTNSSGLADLVIHPIIGGEMLLNVTKAGYVNSTSYVGVPINVLVLPSLGTQYPDDCLWDDLNSDWNNYGNIPVIIDYSSITSSPFSLTDLVNVAADVLVLPYAYAAFTEDEENAIIAYIEMGHGFVTTSNSMYYSPEGLAPFFGITESLSYSSSTVLSLDIIDTLHPIMQNVNNPYQPGYTDMSFNPTGTGWDGSILNGAEFIAIDSSTNDFGAILTHRGMAYFSNVPAVYANEADKQIFYNALIWTDYIVPEHDLSARLEIPDRAEPGDSIQINATVRNQGSQDEIDVVLRLFIEEVEVDNLTISLLVNGTEQTLTYGWTPMIEDIYNVTAFVEYVSDEYSYGNNHATEMVNIRPIKGRILWDATHSNDRLSEHSGYAADLDYEGFVVEEHLSGEITLSLLNDYNALVCSEMNSIYSTSELADIQAFVETGGGLLVMGDSSNEIMSSLTSYAGISFVSGSYSGSATEITDHPVTDGVTSVYFGGTSTVLSVSGNAISLVRGDSQDLVAASEYGGGYVVAICDDHCLIDGNYENGDNAILAVNIMNWMAAGREDHDLAVFLEVPQSSTPDTEVLVNASVINRGLNDETDITLELYIEDTLVDSLYLAFFENGTSETLSYSWTPSVEMVYNITAYVEPVEFETVIANNRMQREVVVAQITLLTDFESGDTEFQTEGLWHLVDDTDPYGNSNSPTHAMWYGQDETGNYDTGSSNMGVLTSRPFVLGSDIVSLSFWSWYETEEPGHIWDCKDIYIILPEEETWVFLGYVSGEMNIWAEYTLDISAFANEIVQFAFKFDTIDSVSNNYRGWYIDDITVIGSLSPIDHDLDISLDSPDEGNVGESYLISTTVSNLGAGTETNVDLRIYIDEVLVDSIIVTALDALETYTLSYLWSPESASIYNITAYVGPVAGEILLSNNIETNFVQIYGLRSFTILEPTSGSTIDGGLVYITYEWSSPASISFISIYVNAEFVSQCPYFGNNDLFAPIFQNGTNTIELVIEWDDAVVTSTDVTIQSENVVPIINPIVGDFADYILEQPGSLIDYNHTFTGESSPFIWDVTFTMAHRDPDTGVITSTMIDYMTVNILNGYIVSSDMGMTGSALLWVTGVDAPMPMQSYAEIGDLGFWNIWTLVYEIVDTDEWNGHPTWILESSGTSYELEVLMPNGILVELRDDSMGLYFYLLDSSFIPEVDTTPPEWVVEPSNQIAEIGIEFEYALEADDDYGFLIWELNDTTYFDINSYGVVSNIGIVPIGIYVLEVHVYDGYLNNISAIFTIEVLDTRGPEWNPDPTDQYLEYGYELAYQLGAFDPSGIDRWEINDTVHFTVSTSGLVHNLTNIAVGIITLEVTVYDIFDQYCSAIFKIITSDTIAPAFVECPTEVIIEFGPNWVLQLHAYDISGIASWSVNDTTYFAVDSTGLLSSIMLLPVGNISLEISVYDVYENQNSITITIIVCDTTAPEWITSPTDITLNYGQELNMQLSAYDLSGIASWTINNTANFNIDHTGLVTNTSILELGIYELTVTVSDVYGNEQTATFTVTIEQSTTSDTTPTETDDTTSSEPSDFTTMVLIVVLGGTLGIVIFIVIIRSRLGKRV